MRIPRLFPKSPEAAARETRAIIALSRRIMGIDPHKVVFRCFQGRSYGDNPRCISERLHERCPEAKIVWLFSGRTIGQMRKAVPGYVKCVSLSDRISFVEMATARVWVDNFTKNSILSGFPKGRQFYIQTWHGDRPIKKICYDEWPDNYRLEEECDLVLTGSDFAQKVYRTAFRYQGEYLNMGCPRNDILVRNDPADVRRVRAKLGVPPDTKLLLYAPTYRENEKIVPRRAQMDLGRILNLLERGGEKWLCLYRAHYKSDGIDLTAQQNRLVDMSQYEDMSELLLVSDMLLTDYSSCAMDFCLLDRPFFMYMADYDEYLSTRGVYYDPHETPLMIAHDQQELEALILRTDAEAARRNCEAVRAYYGMHETGRATDAVCDYIIERLGGRRYR